MSVLTLILPLTRHNEDSQLVEDFTQYITSSLHSLFQVDVSTTTQSLIRVASEYKTQTLILKVKPSLPEFELIKHGDALYKLAAEWSANYIVQYCEQMLLKQAINRRGFVHPDVVEKIESYCQSILNHEQWEGLSRIYTEVDRKRRKSKIVHELYQYFSNEVICHLEGIMAFRLRPYKKEIKDIVEYACDEFVLNQQYEEFISLLKYFVQIQECKIETVHIIDDDRGLELFDEQFNKIVVNDYEERIVVEMLETEINIEDSVISHLVAVAPKRITLHSAKTEMYETKTVQNIFAERIEICNGCQFCQPKNNEMLPFN